MNQYSDDEFDQATSARLAGISIAQFQRWEIRPVRRQGRRAFYRWAEVRVMAERKRIARTKPDDTAVSPATEICARIGAAVEAECARRKPDQARLQRLTLLQMGIALAMGVMSAEDCLDLVED